MPDFKVAKSLKEADSFYLNINFEILNGCKFKCQGCFVEKNAQTPLLPLNIQGIAATLDDFAAKGYQPFLAFLGPTDFLVATNLEIILKNLEFVSLLKRFKRIVFQTTFLDLTKSDVVAEMINEHFKDHEIEINAVFEPSLLLNSTVVEKILTNRSSFFSKLVHTDIKSFTIFNIYNYAEARQAFLLRDYRGLNDLVKRLFNTTIDYNFSSGRNKDLSKSEFLQMSETAKKLFNEAISDGQSAEKIRFSFGKIHDSLLELQLNYRGGDFFYSPLLYERFVSFNEDLKVGESFLSASAYEEYYRQLTLEQYLYSAKTESCESCGFLGTCVDRGILKLMKMYDLQGCIVAKDAWEITASQAHYEENRP